MKANRKLAIIVLSVLCVSAVILCVGFANSNQESVSGIQSVVSDGEDSDLDATDDTRFIVSGNDIGKEEITTWSVEEFEEWMTEKIAECQKLVEQASKSFYYKNEEGIYVAREWRQSDVDVLEEIWKEQLDKMKAGYVYTKNEEANGIVGMYGPIE